MDLLELKNHCTSNSLVIMDSLTENSHLLATTNRFLACLMTTILKLSRCRAFESRPVFNMELLYPLL